MTYPINSYDLLLAECRKRIVKMPKDQREESFETRVITHLMALGMALDKMCFAAKEWRTIAYIAWATCVALGFIIGYMGWST